MKIIIKIKHLIILIITFSQLFSKCDGFNWYHDINLKDCNQNDLKVLQEFIENSNMDINFEMDINFNNKIDPIELGWQLWEEGRLVHWICTDVPSPFYVYSYDCRLSGNIPNSIDQLDALVKLHLQSNNLKGDIPESICNLDITNSNSYWFKINNNNFCPPYPECINNLNTKQKIDQCD